VNSMLSESCEYGISAGQVAESKRDHFD